MARPGNLRSLLQQEAESKKKVRCTMCILARDLDGDDRDTLVQALQDPDTSSMTIARALTAYGVRISGSAISRHRRECSPLE